MAYFQQLLVLFTLIYISGSSSQLSSKKDDLLNWCLKGKNHKPRPGKEDLLHQQCQPWKEHACCTQNVTVDIHQVDMYNFTYNHCYNQTKRSMSDQCRKHFIRDLCFYECEPNIGLWVVGVNRQITKERFYKAPLCSSQCEEWFYDCRDDFTCAFNWPRDFNFVKGKNYCKENSKCITFKEMYSSAKDFCENVWDHAWEYMPDNEPCLHVWFSDSTTNPNRKVAEYYIQKQLSQGLAPVLAQNLWSIFLGLVVVIFLG